MRPSCGYPACPHPSGIRRARDRRPARASGMVPSGGRSALLPRAPRGRWVVGVSIMCVALQCARVSGHEPPHHTTSGVEPVSGRAMPPWGITAIPRPQNPSGSAWRIVKVPTTQRSSRPSGRPDPAVVPTQRSSRPSGRQKVVKPPPKSYPDLGGSLPTGRSRTRLRGLAPATGVTKGAVPPGRRSRPGGAAGIRTPDLRRARAALSQLSYGPARRPPRPPAPTARPGGVGAPGLEPGTSALSGPRSNRLSYAPAAGAVAPSSTAAAPARGSPRVASRPMPKTERAQPARPWRQPWPGDSARPNSGPSVAKTRGATDLPVIRGAPARSCHRLATGRPRGSVPTDAGSPLGGLTRVSSLTTATP
jgi:hypothetical protein